MDWKRAGEREEAAAARDLKAIGWECEALVTVAGSGLAERPRPPTWLWLAPSLQRLVRGRGCPGAHGVGVAGAVGG